MGLVQAASRPDLPYDVGVRTRMVISFVKGTPVCFNSLLKLIFRQPENRDRFASTCFLFFLS